jgi:hypothetical protein
MWKRRRERRPRIRRPDSDGFGGGEPEHVSGSPSEEAQGRAFSKIKKKGRIAAAL